MLPRFRVRLVFFSLMEDGFFATVTVQRAVTFEETLAVIVVFPTLLAVICPLEFTEATLGLLLFQVTLRGLGHFPGKRYRSAVFSRRFPASGFSKTA